MAQGVDGNWYGYFGDKTKVDAADSFANNLDFGTDANPTLATGDFNEATNVYQSTNVLNGNSAGAIHNPPVLSAWNSTGTGTGSGVTGFGHNSTQGQIGVITTGDWPFIQLYDFTTGEYSFNVVYEQAGADEVVTLDYNSGDLDDFAGIELDRNAASQESDVHLTLTDNQLNIDPTSEDKVIFFVGTTGSETMSFTNGTVPGVIGQGNGAYKAWSNTFGDNGKLIINYDTSGSRYKCICR